MAYLLLQHESRPASLQHCKEVLDALPIDKTWVVNVKENKLTRTDKQNRFLWGWVYPQICKYLAGFDSDDVHNYLLGEWSGWEQIDAFGRIVFRPIRRSSKLNVQEFNEYVEFIQRAMAAKGIVISDPHEALPW